MRLPRLGIRQPASGSVPPPPAGRGKERGRGGPRWGPRHYLPLAALLALGCGQVPVPDESPAAVVAALRYPVRSDLMRVGDLGAPTGWYSPGYLPLRTARDGDRSPDAEFAAKLKPLVGKAILDPDAGLTPPQRDDVGKALDAAFGTPAAPAVRVPSAEQAAALKLEEVFGEGLPEGKTAADALADARAEAEAAKDRLGLSDDALARGGVLYRRRCLSCHGPTGGGDGAHAVKAAAPPRDYRQGLFKFVTCAPAGTRKGVVGKARKEDIRRAVRKGIDGSMMPPFAHLSDAEVDDVAAYVIHLSVRGEAEFDTLTRVIQLATNPRDDDPGYSPEFAAQLVAQKLLLTLGNWARADAAVIPVPPENCPTELDRLRSAARGYKAFAGTCAGCHQDYGRAPQLKYDMWGTVVQPRNLLLGVYRGGRRGEDLYARLYAGIYPSTMPDSKAKAANPPAGQPDELWDLVHFLQALADPRERKLLQQLDPSIKLESGGG
ncbi:MAG: cytochrome c [Gemmataceae bacterium]|nr:cytochrome c [Gemmataceae bacterium]